jgi:hypothetical protein
MSLPARSIWEKIARSFASVAACSEEIDFAMFADRIDQMKRDYTDKYVVVDGTRPELARFRDVVGRVKTVNMSGRALVEFDDYHLNLGWFDIDPEFLKVVDKPPPKAPKTEAKKAAPKPTLPGEVASATAKPRSAATKAGKPSVAEMLAAARAGGAGGAAKAGAPAPAKANAESPAAPAKVDRSKMSVADMLAAARAGGASGSATAAPKAPAAPAAPMEEAEEAAAPAPAPAKQAAAAKSIEKVDKSKMTIDEIVAWCRQHDAK